MLFLYLLQALFISITKLKGALIGCVAGAFAMAVLSVVTNYFIVYPVYAELWAGGDMNVIVNM